MAPKKLFLEGISYTMAVWYHLGASATNRTTFHLSISGSSGGNHQYTHVADKPSSCIRKMKLAKKKKQHCIKINSSK
jgi:hypothetical protein